MGALACCTAFAQNAATTIATVAGTSFNTSVSLGSACNFLAIMGAAWKGGRIAQWVRDELTAINKRLDEMKLDNDSRLIREAETERIARETAAEVERREKRIAALEKTINVCEACSIARRKHMIIE
jgi:hypothetical protein